MNKPPPGKHPAPVHDDRPAAGFRTGMVAGVLAALAVAGILAGFTVLFSACGRGRRDHAGAARGAAGPCRSGPGGRPGLARTARRVRRGPRCRTGRARALEDNVAALQVQAGQLRDRLAFYDQLFPAGPAGTLSIRAAEITRVPAGLRYRVLLMRSARPGLAPFVGSVAVRRDRNAGRRRSPPATRAAPDGGRAGFDRRRHGARGDGDAILGASKAVTGDPAGQAAKTMTAVCRRATPPERAAGGRQHWCRWR